MIADPAGLLRRMPELETVARDDAAIRSALESGDPFKVYRSLRWGRWTGRLRAHAEVVKELLANRRLFARPLTSSPGLFTLNSLGLGFVGETERDTDGTYITMHAIVVLFKVPLLPLGSYLVGDGDTDRSYRIYARVPMGTISWLWSRAAALGAALLVLSGAAGAVHDSRYATVRVANGFSKHLEVEVGGKKAAVPPGSVWMLDGVPVGTQPARATLDGQVVDEAPLDVSSGHDAFVWNVGGVAAVYAVDINYYDVMPAYPNDPKPFFFCGQRQLKHNADFLFRDPDSSVSMSKGTKVVTKRLLAAAWRRPEDTRAPCLSILWLAQDAAGLQLASEALRRAGELAEDDEVLPILAAVYGDKEAGQYEAAKALFERKPTAENGRMLVWVADETGHLDEVRADFEARRTAKPEDADAAYLALRASQKTPDLASCEAMLARFPDNEEVRAATQYAALRENKPDRALDLWLQRLDDDADEACRSVYGVAEAALLAHREREVLEALDACGGGRDALAPSTALAAARLSLTQNTAPARWLTRIESEALRDRASLLCQQPVDKVEKTPLESYARLIAAVHKDGASTLAASTLVRVDELQVVESELPLLIWAEAVRTKHEVAKSFARRLQLRRAEREALEAYVNGASRELTVPLMPHERAVVHFVRSRADGIDGAEKAKLVALAKQDAVLSPLLTDALEHWP